MNPDCFPNVWRSKSVNTPSGKLVGVVNMDTGDGGFYAGVHHFSKNQEQETALRWAHQPHATKQQAVKRAEAFVRRGARSMPSRHSHVQRQREPIDFSLGVTAQKAVPTQQEPDMQKFVKPHFFEDHSGKKARVPVYSVTVGVFGSKFKMICYSIPKIAVDSDGAPDANAPPTSATNHHPRNGLPAKDDIRDGTNESAGFFMRMARAIHSIGPA